MRLNDQEEGLFNREAKEEGERGESKEKEKKKYQILIVSS